MPTVIDIRFPDESFMINKDTHYVGLVNGGKKISSEKSILFCGICRNVESRIEQNILRIKETAKIFKDHHIYMYENDSTDATKEIINEYVDQDLTFQSETREDSNYVEILQRGEDRSQFNRCCALSKCRNKYIDFLEKSDRKFDYVAVIDLDLWGGWSYDGIAHSINWLNLPEVGGVTAHGVLSDYHNNKSVEEVHPDHWLMFDSWSWRSYDTKGIFPTSVAQYNYIKLDTSSTPILVDSNFNGLGIYKSECVLGNRYQSKKWSDTDADVEHVAFHRRIYEMGLKILYNPNMVVSYSNHKYSK